VPITAEWLIDCTLDGRMLDTAQYQPPEATEQLLDLYPGLRTVRRLVMRPYSARSVLWDDHYWQAQW